MSAQSYNPPRRRSHWTKRLGLGVQAIAALLATLLFIAPIFWMISTALKTGNQAFSATPNIFFTPTFENFAHVFTGSAFGSALLTSTITSSVSTILALILGAGIAYPPWAKVACTALATAAASFGGTAFPICLATSIRLPSKTNASSNV